MITPMITTTTVTMIAVLEIPVLPLAETVTFTVALVELLVRLVVVVLLIVRPVVLEDEF